MSLLEKKREKIKALSMVIPDDSGALWPYYKIFLDYVEAHPSTSYYYLSKIIQITNCESVAIALDIVNFFSLDDGIITVTYCYFDQGGSDIEISIDDFLQCISDPQFVPVSLDTGVEIDCYTRDRIGFYCNTVDDIFE